MKHIKLFQSAALLAIFANLLSACTNAGTANVKNDPEKKQSISGNPQYQDMSSTLVIHAGCVGCGKCVRFDPEHFGFDPGAHIASVKKTSNLDSRELDLAIKVCPVKVIERI